MANKIGYKLVANMTSTASQAPYMGMAIPVGSLAYDNILSSMIKSGARLTEATAKFFLDAFYEYAADQIAESVVRVNLGDVSVYPMIGGSFESEDAAFDPAKNTLYVGATLSQDVRDAVAGITPDYMGEEDATAVRLNSEMDIASEVFKVIDGTENFRLAGQNLVVPDGADESIALYSKDGLTKVSDITVSGNDGGQQLTCKLKGDAAVPKGTYKIRLVTHGIDPTAPLAVLTYTVTVISAVELPDPKFTGTNPSGEILIEATGTFEVLGENLPVFESEETLAAIELKFTADDLIFEDYPYTRNFNTDMDFDRAASTSTKYVLQKAGIYSDIGTVVTPGTVAPGKITAKIGDKLLSVNCSLKFN